MATTSVSKQPKPRLSDEQLVELLELVQGSKTVEFKLTVPDTDIRSVTYALGMDPLDAQLRQVFFFDTPDLALNKAGVIPRARRIQGKGADTVIKLRPVVPSSLPPDLRKLPNLGIEVDAMPGGYVCSASFKGVAVDADVKAVMAGAMPIRKLFSKEQRAFYTAYAPTGIALDDLAVLGPITLLKLRFAPKDFAGSMVAELWHYPDGSRILELSAKCLPNDAFQFAIQTRSYLTKRGVDLSGEQQTKTRTALDYFAGALKAKQPLGA